MRRFLLIVLITSCLVSSAQVSDVPVAFAALSADPQIFQLKKNYIKVPFGGHLQGIQALTDSQLVITASSSSYSYYLTADRSGLTSVQKISGAPFRHAGGCQLLGSLLFVGVEDNMAKDKSDIKVVGQFFQPQPNIYTAIHRSGTFKRSTAGAVGITSALRGYLLAVADWDSRNIDFYLCSDDGNLARFDSLTTFHAPDSAIWPSYQNINLLRDAGAKIYMVGFARDGSGDRADLFEVDLSEGDPRSASVRLRLINTRYFHCRGTSFRYGSGIYVSPDHKLSIYSIARNATAHTAVNIFK